MTRLDADDSSVEARVVAARNLLLDDGVVSFLVTSLTVQVRISRLNIGQEAVYSMVGHTLTGSTRYMLRRIDSGAIWYEHDVCLVLLASSGIGTRNAVDLLLLVLIARPLWSLALSHQILMALDYLSINVR